MSTILAIETSCDETAAAVLRDGKVLSSVVGSQIELHAGFGGVVPEVASRAHVQWLAPAVAQALDEAGVGRSGPDAVAATVGPGLVGALLVGASAAKAHALAWAVPFIGVNHLEAHLLAPLLEWEELPLPAVVLLVSGGHTLLVSVGHSDPKDAFPFAYRLLGQTIDDAAGEAFDKVARFLGLGYPGGPVIDRLAASGDPTSVAFPRGLINEQGYDFSFSGLKTSVINYVNRHPRTSTEDLAASFQNAVIDVLVTKTLRAAVAVGARAVSLGGGVAANSGLRLRLAEQCQKAGIEALIPDRKWCTDNAAMIGLAAGYRLAADGPTSLQAAVDPNLVLPWA